MTLMFQKIPVSLCCYFTSLRFNPYAQAPEWGGDEEQHQVIATVETATFAGDLEVCREEVKVANLQLEAMMAELLEVSLMMMLEN